MYCIIFCYCEMHLPRVNVSRVRQISFIIWARLLILTTICTLLQECFVILRFLEGDNLWHLIFTIFVKWQKNRNNIGVSKISCDKVYYTRYVLVDGWKNCKVQDIFYKSCLKKIVCHWALFRMIFCSTCLWIFF